MCEINAEEYRSRWGARASNWLESRLYQRLNPRRSGKTADVKPIAYGLFGKTNRHLADLPAVLALAIIVAAVVWQLPHRAPACGIAADAPLPWVQAMRAGCAEAQP